MLNRDL